MDESLEELRRLEAIQSLYERAKASEAKLAHFERYVNWHESTVRALEAEVFRLKRDLVEEKERRVYYQDIVYDVCNQLPKGIVCGTKDSPTKEVQDAVAKLIFDNKGE